MSSPAVPPRPRRRKAPYIAFGALIVVAAVSAAIVGPRSGTKAAPDDPFAFAPPESRPVGPPIPLRSTLAAGSRFSGTGTISYHQSGGGHYGGLPGVPDRELKATFRFTRRVDGAVGSPLASIVAAEVEFEDIVGGAKPSPGKGAIRLTYEHGRIDTSSLRTTKLEAPDDLRPALVAFVEAFTQRTPLVGLDARVGEAFVPKLGMDVEPLRRQAFKLFSFNERGLAPVEGAVWLESVRGEGSAAEATVRTSIRHAQEGVSGNAQKAPVATTYSTVARGLYRIGIADGLAHHVEWSDALRTRYVTPDFDYHAEIRRAVTIDEAKVE